MGEILKQCWYLLLLASIAVSFNMFMISARKGRYDMGSFFRKFGPILELVNWLILLGVVIFISVSESWWFLFAYLIIPTIGFTISSIFREKTQFIYLIGMPIMIILTIFYSL